MRFADTDADPRFLSLRVTRGFILSFAILATVSAVALAMDRRSIWPIARWNGLVVAAASVGIGSWAAPRVSRRVALVSLAVAIVLLVAAAVSPL